MKAGLSSLVFACLLSLSLEALPKIAVFDAIVTAKIDKDVGTAITEKITEELVSSGRFVILDRTLVNRSLKEIKFQMSSLTGDEEIQKAGEQLAAKLGVSYIVTVRVSLISDTYLVSAKMIDMKTGGIVAQASDEVEGKASATFRIAQSVGRRIATSEAVASSAGGVLKVAILAPLSGPVPTFGISVRDGAMLAINEWNANGGVLGLKIAPIIEDSQCTPDPAVNAANEVINQDKVHYIVGEVCSKASIPISEIANAAKVIQISPTSTNTAVTVGRNGDTKAYIFRACFIDPFQGKIGAVFAVTSLKAKTAFVMYDPSNDYVRGLAEEFESTFIQLGGTTVGKETYDGENDTDFSAILTKVKNSEPDVVYLPDYYNVVNLAARQAKAMGISAPFMGGDGWDSSDLDVEAADGGYYSNHYDTSDPRSEVRDFLHAYGAAYKDGRGNPKVPDALAALAYDATNLLLTAIRNARADDTDKVKAAMEAISFNAVTGRITFDAQHNPIKGGVIVHVKGGEKIFDSFVFPAAALPESWNIPFLNSLSGEIASIGEYLEWGAERAAKEINNAGGIKGKSIRVLGVDTATDPLKGSMEMVRIVKDSLVALGPVPETVFMAAMPIAVQSGMPSILASTSLEYAQKFFPWTISWFPSTRDRLAPLVAAWARQFPDMKHVVQFVENYGPWPGMADAHVAGFTGLGIKVLEKVEVPGDAVTFGPLVVKALNEKPDGIVFVCKPASAAKLIKELKSRGWKNMDHLLLFSSADVPELYVTGGKDLNGAEIYNYINPNLDNPRWNAFKQAYADAHNGGEPPSLSTNYYDAVYMIKDAIENTGVSGSPGKLKAERKMIADYLQNAQGFHGIMFDWDMKDGVPTNKPTYIFKIQDGQKILVQEVRPREP